MVFDHFQIVSIELPNSEAEFTWFAENGNLMLMLRSLLRVSVVSRLVKLNSDDGITKYRMIEYD